MLSIAGILLLATTGIHAKSRTPPNPIIVPMYNLRPYNLTSDISDKDSADAMGDIFFYLTDRLTTPYTCRHSSQIHPPFMCSDYQKVLQTPDQVYTKLQVIVDSSFGGCADGSMSCTQYADCNPINGNASNVTFKCDCDSQGLSSATQLQSPRALMDDNYWRCKSEVERLCGHQKAQCAKCVAQHRHTVLNSCSDEVLAKSCSSNSDACRTAVDASKCNQPGTPLDVCVQCAQRSPKTEEANCSASGWGGLRWFCQSPPKYCSATGRLAVETRYCGAVDHNGLCSICADECDGIWARWKSQISHLGGIWYSTAKEGNCSNSESHCSWKVLKKEKTVNATCANNNVHAVVEKKGQSCFSRCSQPTNTTSDCWILCFIQTVLGRDPLNLNKTLGTPMQASELTGPWLQSFESDDPANGGCPALPSAPPSAPPSEILAV